MAVALSHAALPADTPDPSDEVQSSSSDHVQPPYIAAPEDATPVIVTLSLQASDAEAFKAHLMRVIPVTRIASGQRFSWSLQDADDPRRFTLVQGWDSLEQQQAYMAWRAQRGDLDEFMAFLTQEPMVDIRPAFDR